MTDSDIHPLALTIAKAMTEGTPHARALGLEVTAVSKGEAIGSIPFRPELAGDSETGVIAGGVLTAMLDHVCGVAAMTAQSEPQPVATLDLRIDYMRPAAPGASVFAKANCYKLTRSVAFVRAVAYESDPEDPVASATAAFMLTGGVKKAGSNLRPPRKT